MCNLCTRNHFETNARDEVDEKINQLKLSRNNTWLIFNLIPSGWFVAASVWTMLQNLKKKNITVLEM